jgi:hypothetical protein
MPYVFLLYDDSIVHVRTLVASCFPNNHNAENLVKNILANYIKVFAVLLLIDQDDCFGELERDGVDDASLPLVPIERTRSSLARPSAPRQALLCFESWKTSKREDFAVRQHLVNPPYLSFNEDKTIRHQKFERPTIFPFLEEVTQTGGGYGEIVKVKIHRECHGFHDIIEQVRTLFPRRAARPDSDDR